MARSRNILDQFKKLNVWQRGDLRAPHKPLLALYALGRFARGEASSIRFVDLQEPVTELLREFGPSRKSYHPEFPFWHLQSDGVWSVNDAGSFHLKKGGSSPTKGELIRKGATGELHDEVRAALERDPDMVPRIAKTLLEAHFPESLHSDILLAVGLDLTRTKELSAKRDPNFRSAVLTAYEYRCAVCGLDLRLHNTVVALEAAHIKWRQARGPDTVDNGLALCVLHHKTFDLGAFTVQPNLDLLVSEQVHGSQGVAETLLGYHGQKIREPQSPNYLPREEFLSWHKQQVFKGQPRHLGAYKWPVICPELP